MWLINQTTDETGYYTHAVLDLTPQVAKDLLKYRKHCEKVKKVNSALYCLEFFDGSVEYGTLNEPNMEDAAGGWYVLDTKPELDSEFSRTSAPCMRVTESGILWSAWAKHSSDYFETDEVSWADLLAVARGERPFEKLAEIGE